MGERQGRQGDPSTFDLTLAFHFVNLPLLSFCIEFRRLVKVRGDIRAGATHGERGGSRAGSLGRGVARPPVRRGASSRPSWRAPGTSNSPEATPTPCARSPSSRSPGSRRRRAWSPTSTWSRRRSQEAGVRQGKGAVVLTGSGSSLYVGECLALPLQQALRVPVSARWRRARSSPIPSERSPGRSLRRGLARAFRQQPRERGRPGPAARRCPRAPTSILTCNGEGALATRYGTRPRVRTLVLDEKTNDKSLVMTSSFTNMVLAGWALGRRWRGRRLRGAGAAPWLGRPSPCCARSADGLARVARRGFSSAVYLGSGCRLGGARESSLKMLEMSDGAGVDLRRVLSRPAPRSHVGGARRHRGRGLPLLEPGGPGLRARLASRAGPEEARGEPGDRGGVGAPRAWRPGPRTSWWT